MTLQAEVDAESAVVQRITAVACRTSCPVFIDLLWPPAPPEQSLLDDPGVMFESPTRVVVFQWVGSELRFYAGGWCPNRSRLSAEQDRVWAEGCELGVFGSVAEALAFAEQYLVGGLGFGAVLVPREVGHCRQPR
jgi:hypothetical protein